MHFHQTNAQSMRQLARFFIISCATLLFAASVLKMASAFGNMRLLNAADPVFAFISNRQMLILVASVEVIVCMILIGVKSEFIKLACTAWISTCFVLYRTGLWILGVRECMCLGNALNWIGIERQSLSRFTGILAVLMMVGSIILLKPHFAGFKHSSN